MRIRQGGPAPGGPSTELVWDRTLRAWWVECTRHGVVAVHGPLADAASASDEHLAGHQ